ncbi:hypothetical protein GCM10010191_14530 [Actinomadura vinacea]|uniref:Uncharacterized protein n=1 Tax=Actinomadura vinacea TaxID=115336 RepID=A0ABN3IMI0_9ACTN
MIFGGRPSGAGLGGVQEPGFGLAHCWSDSTPVSCARIVGASSPDDCPRTVGQAPAPTPITPAATVATTGIFPSISRALRPPRARTGPGPIQGCRIG